MIYKILQKIMARNAPLFLRWSIAAGFISAVSSRLGFWGRYSSGWQRFTQYTGELLYYLPSSFISYLAIMVTVLETLIGLALLLGLYMEYCSLIAGGLTLLFAIIMAIAEGVKESLDYSVFVFSAACFMLASKQEHTFIPDQIFK